VVQIYARLPDADAPERLIGFTRVAVQAGQDGAFTVRVPMRRLATRDPVAHAWRSPAGRHRISVARHAGDPSAVAIEIER
jgi:beta-glucosidase